MESNLMDGLFSEMNRVREVIKEYEHPDMKGAGSLAASLIKMDIAEAESAIKENNVIKMLMAYNNLLKIE